MSTENEAPSATMMTSACSTNASASSRRPPPSARAIADEMPPPIAPAEIICISITPGNASAMPASASVPSFATHQVSMSPVAACANITSTFGEAIRNNVGTIGPCSSRRARALSQRPPCRAEDRPLTPWPRRSSRAPFSRTAFLASCDRTRRGLCHGMIARCVLSADALVGGGTRDQCVVRLLDRPPGGGIGEDGIDRRAGLGVDELYAWAFRGKVLVSPGQQRDKDRTKIAPARGQHIFVSRRPLAVLPALQKSRIDQRIEPARQDIRRDPETLLELIEAREPVQGITQNENAPPFAHALKTAGDRTGHPGEALALH